MDLNKKSILRIVAIVLITAFLSIGATVLVMNSMRGDTVKLRAEEYKQLSDLFVIRDVMETVEKEHYGKIPTREEMIANAAKGIVQGLDDVYARYYTAKEYEDYLSSLNGEYSGVGMLVAQPDGTGAEVLDVYKDNSAERAGIKTGDIITSVNDVEVKNMPIADLASLMNGEIGSVLKIAVLRNNEKMSFDVVCETVNIKRVDYALFNQATGYIRIDMFTGSCAEEFSEAIKYLKDRGMRSLVIDLRNNPGGSLETVVDVADTLLGDCKIVTVSGKTEKEDVVYKGSGKGVEVPVAVIVNENSASASEILAGAVKDNNKGVVVGMTTYGKGIVQTTFKINADSSWLKITTSAYLTPNGTNIHGVGIVPDIEVELPDSMQGIAISKLDQEDDAQLWAALDYVREQADDGE
ncbi:MAG: S41 family peptidase [Clostridia bacterium]|nr:S41 family peptidase [Clostridia bacterium]